ncbi:MAG TPA: superoxide dismutase [Polyangia bacterium]|jgi:Cu-Zn family superoxide dismutase|nr:superoxide dismutase [Polyangia bacterium]
MIIRSRRTLARTRSATSPSILAAFLALALAGASACDNPLPSSYNLPGNTAFPEGIAADTDRGTFYASSLAQGTIFRGRLGERDASVFLQPGQDGRAVSLGLNLDRARNRLFVSGGATGLTFVYDTNNGQLLGKFSTGVTPSSDPNAPTTFVNDVTVLSNGDAYFTDSIVPTVFRLPASAIGQGSNTQPLEAWLDLNNTAFQYQSGSDLISSLNANGIVASPDGQYLVVVQTNTGKLFRITVATKQVTEITGVNVPGGDGLVVSGTTLYAVHQATPPIVRINMAADFASGTDSPLPSQPTGLLAPTTAALAGNRLLIVNSQIDKLFAGTAPTPPFTVTAFTLP